MHSLESSLIDIMRAENDSIKGNFPNITLILVNSVKCVLLSE